MPDELEITIRQQVGDRFRVRSQECLNGLFAVHASHTNVIRVVCPKYYTTWSGRQESVECDQRRHPPGLSILNGRARNLAQLTCALR